MFSIPRSSLNILLLFCIGMATVSFQRAAYSNSNQSQEFAIGHSPSFSVTGNGTPTGQTFVCPGGVPSKFFSSDLTIKARGASENGARGFAEMIRNIPEQGNFFINITVISGHVDSHDHNFWLKGIEKVVVCGVTMKSGASVLLSGSCGQNG